MYFNPTAREQSTLEIAPTAIAPNGSTEEHAGVIATKPATTPDAAPKLVAWPSRIFSTVSQANIAAPVATNVFRKVMPAAAFDATAEPALNPNHPNQSNPAPTITKVRLCGLNGSRPKPARLPITSTAARPAIPALI